MNLRQKERMNRRHEKAADIRQNDHRHQQLHHVQRLVPREADPTGMEQTPGRPVAVFGDAAPWGFNGPETEFFSRETLQAWMQYMEDYGAAWLADTGKEFYSQEYWYLVAMTLVRHWQGAPLNVSDACRSMKTGSSKTRENRLKKLIAEHWCIKIKDRADLRRTYLEPTQDMLLLGGKHFRASLDRAVSFLWRQRLLKRSPAALLREIEGPDRELDKLHLLPWAEFLIAYTDDWNQTFRSRFRTDEYWLPFVRCLRGGWANQPLTMGEACQCMSTGSTRTREKRIALAVSRGMLQRQRGGQDLRVTSILPTSALESRLLSHFTRTLSGVDALVHRLLGSSPRR